MSEFKELVNDCGMTLKGAAGLLGKPKGTLDAYSQGLRTPPQQIIEKLERYRMAARLIFGENQE